MENVLHHKKKQFAQKKEEKKTSVLVVNLRLRFTEFLSIYLLMTIMTVDLLSQTDTISSEKNLGF